jgi:Bifunctional DNA primase/polymerase, N-terminal.
VTATPAPPPLDIAKQLDSWGFNVVPAIALGKRPTERWKTFQDERTTGKLAAWFGGNRPCNFWTTTGSLIRRICLDCDNAYTEAYWREVIGPAVFDATTTVRTRHGCHKWAGGRCAACPVPPPSTGLGSMR